MFKPIYNFFHAHYHRKYHGIYAHAKQLFVFDICLLVLAVGMLTTALVFFFWKPSIAEQIEFHISLGDTRVLSGQIVPVNISYTNHSKVTMKHTVLTYKFPRGFILDTASLPTGYTVENNSLALPDVPPGGNGEVQLHGKLWTDIHAQDSLVAILSYTQNDATEKDQKTSRFFINLPGSVVSVGVAAPTSTLAGTTLPVQVRVHNVSDEPLLDIGVTCDPLLSTTSTLNPITLTPGAAVEIPATVKLAASRNIVCSATHRVNGSLFTIAEATQAVVVVRPDIRIRATIDSAITTATAGARIPLTISWRNSGQVALTDQKIQLNFTPGVVDIPTTARENNLVLNGESLIITKDRRSALGDGTPGSNDTFTITVTLKKSFTAPASATGFSITPAFIASTPGVVDGAYTQTGAAVSLSIPAELGITSDVRYFTDEGDQLGRGPLPPRVGLTTKYWVLVTLTNKFSDVTSAGFTATLPTGVSFTGNQSVTVGPSLTWHAAQRTVYWSLPRLAAGSQTGIYFEVAVTPTEASIGQTIQLTGPLSFTATDTVTGKSIASSNPAKTNTLGANDKGSSKGALVTE